MAHCHRLIVVLVLMVPLFVQGQEVTCGTERWDVKDLNDRDAAHVSKHVVHTSVRDLVAMPGIKARKDDPRHEEERRVFRVRCRIAKYKLESDSDIHLVIEDPDDPSIHMIAEIPDPRCPDAIEGGHAAEFRAAKEELEKIVAPHKPGKRIQAIVPGPIVHLTGVCFFDPPHGQTGRAPNNMELHPVLKIEE